MIWLAIPVVIGGVCWFVRALAQFPCRIAGAVIDAAEKGWAENRGA